MKITYPTSKINSFGGINFANSIIGNAQVFDTIDQMLGTRGVKAQYRYSDLFRSYLLMSLCGGETNDFTVQNLYKQRGSDVGEPIGVLQKIGWKDQKKDFRLHLF